MANGQFGGGDGTKNNPYLVEDSADLKAMNDSTEEYFKQVNDIDLNNIEWTPINNFRSCYDGDNHVIKNLKISTFTGGFLEARAGLFGAVISNTFPVVLKNIVLQSVNISCPAVDEVGALAGSSNADLENIIVSGGNIVGRDEVGGVVGTTENSFLNRVSFNGSVSGARYVGGINGRAGASFSTIEYANIVSSGSVTGNLYVGGIAGHCYGNTTSFDSITKCVSSARVSGNRNVGGLFGYIDRGFVRDSYALNPFINKIGDSTYDTFGDIFGSNNATIIVYDTYRIASISSNTELRYNAKGVISESQARDSRTYATFDFGEIWGIQEGMSYPFLLSIHNIDQSIPFTVQGRLIRVDQHEEGTMFYENNVYRILYPIEKTQRVLQGFFQTPYFVIGRQEGDIDLRTIWFIASSSPLYFDTNTSEAGTSQSLSTSFSYYLDYIHPDTLQVVDEEPPRLITDVTKATFKSEQTGERFPITITDANYDVYSTSGSLLVRGMSNFNPLDFYHPNILAVDADEVTFVYFGDKVEEVKEEGKDVLVFLASGIEDHDAPGGYSNYQPLTERTVEFLPDRSNNVNFYYIATDIVSYDYLLHIATPFGVAPIILMNDEVSGIKCVMYDGNVAHVSLVDVDDENASPIKVMTPSGVKALEMLWE